MTVDSFSDSSEDVLNELDPLSRALLDLSVQRGMEDAEIAQVLGTDEESVFEVRVGLLRSLAQRVAPEQADAELPELEAAVAARLYPEDGGEPDTETPVAADDVGDEVDEAEPDEAETVEPVAATPLREPARRPEPRERKRRSPLVVLLPLLLLITIAALIIALAGGDDDQTTDQPAVRDQPQQQPDGPAAPDEPAGPRAVRLTPLGAGNATGSASLRDDELKLRASGLPGPNGGAYTVWLYDSVMDAKRLTDLRGRTATATLPEDAAGYEFIDVSLEPRDGNANHSGRSVLRVELAKLTR